MTGSLNKSCRKPWLWVLLCTALIYSGIPLARSVQHFVYDKLGREFFTYTVIIITAVVLVSVLYALIFKFRIANISQYVWLFLCTAGFIYISLGLNAHPEEAIHLIEYGALAFFVFNALSNDIQDKTAYLTSAFIVSFIGTMEEVIQWITPGRYFDYRDVGINALGGVLVLLAICSGIRPKFISKPAGKISFKLLAGSVIINLILLGLCLFLNYILYRS